MKFFVDTAEIDQIAELNALGMVDGVTTNPSLIMKSGRDIIGVTREICSIVSGPVSAEVTATEATAMIAGILYALNKFTNVQASWLRGGNKPSKFKWHRVA